MTDWRTFEKGALSFSIRREGIRCFLGWGEQGTKRGGALRMTCDDEQHAEKHMASKIRERLRKGFVEAAGRPAPIGDPEALVVETIVESSTNRMASCRARSSARFPATRTWSAKR